MLLLVKQDLKTKKKKYFFFKKKYYFSLQEPVPVGGEAKIYRSNSSRYSLYASGCAFLWVITLKKKKKNWFLPTNKNSIFSLKFTIQGSAFGGCNRTGRWGERGHGVGRRGGVRWSALEASRSRRCCWQSRDCWRGQALAPGLGSRGPSLGPRAPPPPDVRPAGPAARRRPLGRTSYATQDRCQRPFFLLRVQRAHRRWPVCLYRWGRTEQGGRYGHEEFWGPEEKGYSNKNRV